CADLPSFVSSTQSPSRSLISRWACACTGMCSVTSFCGAMTRSGRPVCGCPRRAPSLSSAPETPTRRIGLSPRSQRPSPSCLTRAVSWCSRQHPFPSAGWPSSTTLSATPSFCSTSPRGATRLTPRGTSRGSHLLRGH
ncbi:MAG: hypothetical protein AVDCRST_MAG29-343, partial [uncultured Nocardioidaceae bacterium]